MDVLSITNFQELQKRVRTHFIEKNYNDAISLLKESKFIFPNKIDRIGQWLANIHCLQENDSEAILELNEVVTKGLWWNPFILTSDDELSSIHHNDKFLEIVKKCEILYEDSKQKAVATHTFVGNSEAKTMITALHWRGFNATDFSEQVATSELKEKYLFSFIQSSQLLSYDCYTWDEYEISKGDILHNQMTSSGKNQILFGASQGADTAIKLCLDENSMFNHAVALVPTFNDLNFLEDLLLKNEDNELKLTIITGDKDPFYQNVLTAISVFEKHNIQCEFITIEGMGHQLPPNFNELLSEIVENIFS